MTKDYTRTDRIAEQIQRDIALMLQTEIKDPRLGIVTISAVEVSKDLSHAKVFYTTLADDPQKRKATATALESCAGFMRHLLGQRLHIRVIPALRFVYDDSVERGTALGALIDAAVAKGKPSGD